MLEPFDVLPPEALAIRTEKLRHAIASQPGCTPYDNLRPMRVKAEHDGLSLLAFLCQRHPHVGEGTWQEVIAAGDLRVGSDIRRGKSGTACMDSAFIVHAGLEVCRRCPDFVEPPVSDAVTVLYEDLDYVIVDKPAPLPIHPSGRFNRNSLVKLMDRAWADLSPLPVHRLDANTTGIVVFAKHRRAAKAFQEAMTTGKIRKVYLAKVLGLAKTEHFLIEEPIDDEKQPTGARRVAKPVPGDSKDAPTAGAKAAKTEVRVVAWDEGQKISLLEVRPLTGRTNQIRLHLAAAGLPIVGDLAYGIPNPGRPKPGPKTQPTQAKPKPLSGESAICLHALSLYSEEIPALAQGVSAHFPTWAETP